jgi:hypothetical protein
MVALKKWVCVQHGGFECSHPICPAFDCDSHTVAPAWLPQATTTGTPGTEVHPRGPALHAAQVFLHMALGGGPVPAREILHQAQEAGHAAITVRRAKAALHIESIKEGGHFSARAQQQWRWRLR